MINKLMLPRDTIDKLVIMAERRTFSDMCLASNFETVISDCAGGNIDDAYEIGCDDGQTEIARLVLEALNISFNKEWQ